MRLLRTDFDLSRPESIFEQFEASDTPGYAILSHTWQDDEVLFSHMFDGSAPHRSGYRKIKYATDQARRDRFDYIWIDTCCIDKTSSAELSEAINSMYTWYEQARICYAYLVDVPAGTNPSAENSAFSRCKWFTRGWTLQELLAPKDLIFFSQEWVTLGTKLLLANIIATITGIDLGILTGRRHLESISVAARMSWAAKRKTARLEDMAYCLMGIFSVNMPMLYGEGTKAFHRLQEEIMRHSDDHSIFTWTNDSLRDDELHGLLADSPEAFARSGNIVAYSDWEERSHFSMSNRGLRIELHLTKVSRDIYQAALNCPTPATDYREFVTIYLKKVGSWNHQYARVMCRQLGSLPTRGVLETIFIRQSHTNPIGGAIWPAESQFVFLRKNTGVQQYECIDMVCVPITTATTTGSIIGMIPTPWVTAVRQWLPRLFPGHFQVMSGQRRLSAALLFRRKSDDKCFAVLFGTMVGVEIGFNIIDFPGVKFGTLDSLQRYFNPKPAGTSMELEEHQVLLAMESQSRDGKFLHIVDIFMSRPQFPLSSDVEQLQIRPSFSSSPPDRSERTLRRRFSNEIRSRLAI